MCSYKRAGWFCSRDLSFSNWDIGNKWAGNFATWTLHPSYCDDSCMNSGGPYGIIWHCLLYFPHHKHPIQLQQYSLKSCQSYDRWESYNNIIFVFCHVCFVSWIWYQNVSPGSLVLSHLRNQAEFLIMNPMRNSFR